MSRGRNYGKKQPDIALQMECLEEPLTQEQAAAYNKGEKEYKEVTTRLQDMVKNMGGEIVEKTDSVYVVQMTAASPSGGPPVPALTAATPTPTPTGGRPAGPSATLIAQPPPATTTMGGSPQPSVMTRAAAGNAMPGTYQLVMDPRLGLIVGAVTSAQPTPGTPVIQNSTSLAKTPPIAPVVQTRSTVQTRTSALRVNASPTVVTPPQKQITPPVNKIPLAPAPTVTPQPTPTVPPLRIKAPKPPPPSQKTPPATNATVKPNNAKATTPATGGASRPTEGNSVGGLSAGPGSKPWRPPTNATDNAPVVDLTDDDKPAPSLADTREITFNKLSGKTFPSLVVVARPNLRIKDMSQATISQERAALDSKVKSVLMYSATKFTEWLIQQGLVKSEQYCTTHVMPDGTTPVKLKLGMYSDVSKFPYSGGYVWISECCPLRFVSVFSGSIFEGAPHPPTVLLKLMYHWACQTNVQNVVQWVKVDNFYVKNFFTNMRSICTTAIHEKYEKMGGLRKRVEVGVISLGTTSQDGNMRQVKVEVLGVMEPESKLIRLRAVEPLQDGERNYKRRFVKILEPLEQWVDKDSIILTDFTVDKGTLHNMGFSSVYQVSISDNPNPQNKYSNQNVMEYLRRIVPRMFQNTLSLLSRQIIQQFLDELVWRERWGPVASQAFDNIIIHMAEQTKLETGDSLLTRLFKVAANPFKNWTYSSWKSPPTPKTPITNGTTSPPAPAPAPTPAPEPEPIGPISSIDMLPQSIRTIDPPPTQNSKRSRKRAATATPGEGSEAKRTASASPAPTSTSTPPPAPLPEEQVPLDSYYYGSLEGDAQIIKEEYKTSDINAKCCVCHRKYSNNIALMKHLIMHAQSENQFSTELSDVTQCKYCLKTFPTPFSMQTHIEEIHLKTSTSQVCRICEEKFRDRGMLISHMHRTHTCLELPYECGVCKFRSSMHRDLIDHFYEVHYGGEKFQCPFCLKIVAFANHGKKISANVHFFLNHIQKHQRKSIARKCNKCSMWFVHKGILKEHQVKDHISFKDVPGVKPFVNPSGMEIMMPFPPVMNVSRGGPLQHKRALAAQLKAIQSASYATKKFESPLTICDAEGTKCCECEGDVLEEDHFVGYLTCLRCRYATCCSKAMAEHAVVFHETSKPEFTQGRIIQLPSEMYCVCGYKCSSGNKLAKHLARCERKSAYPSPSQAKAATIQSASFPPLVTLDDVDNPGEDPSDRWLKAFVPSRKEDPGEGSKDAPDKKNSAQQESKDPPSMLNILGLVRKPSTDDSSLDKAPSDSEGQTESKTEAGEGQTESDKHEEPTELQEGEGKAEPADKEEKPETVDKKEKMEEDSTPHEDKPPEPEEEKMEVDASEPVAMETDEVEEAAEVEKPKEPEETKEPSTEQSKERDPDEAVVEENKMEASPVAAVSVEPEEANSQIADEETELSAETDTGAAQETSATTSQETDTETPSCISEEEPQNSEEQEEKESTTPSEKAEDMNTDNTDTKKETQEPSSPNVNSNEDTAVPEKSVVQDE